MLDYHDRSQTETWSQAPTVAWQASPTMAQPSEPKYAWSAEATAPVAESAPGRWSRLGRPMAFVAAGAGVTAAAAAALAIVFGGATTSTAVATPNASTAIAATHDGARPYCPGSDDQGGNDPAAPGAPRGSREHGSPGVPFGQPHARRVDPHSAAQQPDAVSVAGHHPAPLELELLPP